MTNALNNSVREASILTLSVLAWQMGGLSVEANPTGGSVAQGAATFNSAGSAFTVNQTSANALINWQSFNIGSGETTTFVQPSSSSVAWNQINGGSPSQILGTLNANGYVILQNQSGFYVGGNAAISAHGLVMTTSPTPAPTVSGGGAWEFDTPPVGSEIINYGKINISGGGSAFLIADNIQNHGTISAPQGKIGLYDGEQVLLSPTPDGHGINTKVTLPQGSVDNQGNLIADGGSIAALAKTVNNNGLVQANSVQNNNGVIELVASDNVNLGANSVISAHGDSTGISSGGSVTVKSDNTFSDQVGSTINVAGGAQGGNGGQVEVSAPNLGSIQSQVNGHAAAGFSGAAMTIDPTTITLDAPTESSYNSLITGGGLSQFTVSADDILVNASWTTPGSLSLLNITANDSITFNTVWNLVAPAVPSALNLTATSGNITFNAGSGISAPNWTLALNGALKVNAAALTLSAAEVDFSGAQQANSISQASSVIDINASDNITLNTFWTWANAGAASSLNLSAGNSIILNPGASIFGGNNWSLNLLAGTSLPAGATPPHISDGTQSDGVYLLGNAALETQNGSISVYAANEVQINSDPNTSGLNGIRTEAGGNISVTAQYGDVNTGGNTTGFDFVDDAGNSTPPYYSVYQSVGGISTVAGGNVTINAGGSVTSYLPQSTDVGDPGTGAFGAQPGNVTINAGGGVYGHYVLANGVGSITSQSGDVGLASGPDAFALSLVSGSWSVNAPDGNIYLQEVRNPNGIFNNQGGNGNHWFDYAPNASVSLNAGDGVYLTDLNLPRNDDVQVIYPPELSITAGLGGVNLGGNVTLFPSADQNLSIVTTGGGSLTELADLYVPYYLLMSDSAQTVWTGPSTFGPSDHGPLSAEPTDPTPVTINISGNMENLELITTKATQINVSGDMVNCDFSGQNLHASGAGSVTSINVGGQIYNQSAYTYVNGVTASSFGSIPASDLLPGTGNATGTGSAWDAIFALAMDPTRLANLTVPSTVSPSQYLNYVVTQASLFNDVYENGRLVPNSGDQGFLYDAASQRLYFGGLMQSSLLQDLTGGNTSGQFTILHLVNGSPVLDSTGHFETDTVSWLSPSLIQTLYSASQSDPATSLVQYGFRVGGPGQFDITAGAISLGDSYGILTCGVIDPQNSLGNRYNNLASITPAASADLNIEITGADQTQTEVYQFQDGSTINILPHASLDMLTSTIASIGGGNISILSQNGSVDLGSEALSVNTTKYEGLGVFTAGGGNIQLEAEGNVNVDGSRVATYDGGNIFIESFTGDVDAGSGSDALSRVMLTYEDDGTPMDYQEQVYGSGLIADTLVPEPAAAYPPSGSSVTVAKAPGNITVLTPEGSIISTLGGITQESLGHTTPVGPTIDLEAGDSTHVGNIDLGQSGVIGGAVTIKATGSIKGPIISRQNATVQAVGSFSGSVLSGGKADVSGSSVSGVIVGVGGVSVSGGSVTAEVLGQNVSVNGGASQSTLGNTAAPTSASQSAAQTANNEAKAEVASTSNDDDLKKKKHALLQRVKRVTVILPDKT